jgi:hypothetical protein
MRSLPAIVLIFLAWGSLHAQQTIYDETRVLYRKEMAGGVTVHGDGWGLNFVHSKHITARERRVLGVEVVGMKHPKEIKSFNPYYEDSRGYFYGKQNSMLVVRPTFGRKIQLTDKIRQRGVEVNLIWGVGPSLALLKPIYLQIGKPDNFPYQAIATEKYDPNTHGVQNIYGRASWFTGVGEMSILPGAFGRFGFNFEHSGQASGIKALEVGVSMDAYARTVPIMAEVEGIENKQFFLQFYFALQFGKKFIQ